MGLTPPGLNIDDLTPRIPSAVGTPAGSSSTTGGGPAQTQRFNRLALQYDNPFLDMTSTFIPARYKDVLRILAAFVLNNGLVNQTILRMSEYPITELQFGDTNDTSLKEDKTIDFWRDIIEKRLKFRENARQAGINYHAYGNSFVSINFPFKRMLKCSKCGKMFDAVANNARYKQYKFVAKCPEKKCGYSGECESKDIPTKELSKLRYVHWDILQMDIKYNTVTGEHFYYYTPDKELRRQVSRGDMDIINGLRIEVLEAIRTNKKLRISLSNMYHYKRIGAQYVYPQERGWGISAVLPALKDLFHAQILKKGNESISFDHINPLRVLYPNSVGEVSPHSMINLGDWRTKIEEEVLKWRNDPNHISVMPIPVGLDNLFGDAKLLMVHQELRQVQDDAITSLGVIPELIRGGASWSGSSVSLRVVENGFINYRTDMQGMMDWTINHIAAYFQKSKMNIKFSDFKMADDLQQKQLLFNAVNGSPATSLISRTTAIKELGFDPQVEYDNKLLELNQVAEIALKDTKNNAEATGAGQIIAAMFQADAQIENQNRMNAMTAKNNEDMSRQRAQEAQDNGNQVVAEINNVAPAYAGQINIGKVIMTLTDRFAQLQKTDPTNFKIKMLACKNETPGMYEEIYKNLKEMNVIEADTMPDIAASQLYTPGTIPVAEQGGTTAEEPSSPVEQGQDVKPLPEQRPSTSETAPI